jgi:hypothetical protein
MNAAMTGVADVHSPERNIVIGTARLVEKKNMPDIASGGVSPENA